MLSNSENPLKNDARTGLLEERKRYWKSQIHEDKWTSELDTGILMQDSEIS
jgi:hypothetical protein